MAVEMDVMVIVDMSTLNEKVIYSHVLVHSSEREKGRRLHRGTKLHMTIINFPLTFCCKMFAIVTATATGCYPHAKRPRRGMVVDILIWVECYTTMTAILASVFPEKASWPISRW